MVSFVLWEHEAQVRFLHPRPNLSPGDGIGIRVGLRSQILGVRVSSGAPHRESLWITIDKFYLFFLKFALCII